MTRPVCGAAFVLLACFAVQNLEEVLFLPRWMATNIPPGPPVTALQFTLATVLLTVLAAGIVISNCLHPGRWQGLLLAALAGTLLGNALTHILVSLGRGSIMPGAITGLFLQGPAAAWVLWRLTPRVVVVAGWAVFGLFAAPVAALAALVIAAQLVN